MSESAKLAESTAILLNVSEFSDATEASEALISTMQAFQYTADESVHVVDILNEVGNNYAVSSDGIATALQDSASALMEGGNNLEQAVALVAAANRVVQDPSSVGSALRTISLRLRGTSVEVLEEIGEETDGVIESTSKLQKKIQALSGVNILTESGDYKDTYTILLEIGEVWEEMSDIDQAALLELMAGKNRANTLSAILSNMKDLKGAYEDAAKAEGSALKENEAYLNSIQGRIDLFNNSVQTMWMNTISSDMVKFFVDMGTAVVNLIDKIGGLNVALAALAGYAVLKFKFGGLFDGIGAGIVALTNAIKGGAIAKIFSDVSGFVSIIKEGKTLGGMFANLANFIGLTDSALGKYIKNLISTSVLNSAMAGTTTTLGFTFGILKTAVLDAAKAIITFFAANPVIGWAILAVTAIVGIVAAVDTLTTSHKEYLEKLEETNKEIQDIRSNLESLNSELESTNQRIEELENKGPLTLTEQEELEKLKAQNAELERLIQLEEAREQRARNKQAEQASGAFDTDKDFKARTVIDLNGDVSVTNKFENRLDDIAKAKEDMENAETALQDAINSGMDTESKKFKKLEKNLESAQEDYTNAQSEWDEFIKNKESEYADLEWFDGDNLTESQKKVNQIISSLNNYNDKAEIMFGSAGAKESALDRIFGERGSEAGKSFLKEFNAQVDAGTINVEVSALDDYSTAIDDVTNSVEGLINKNPQLKLQLDSLGISVEDVARYFLDIDEAVQQTSTSVSIAATDMSTITSAYEAYASALNIANEAIYEGQAISQEHYDSLKEYLGDVTVGEEDFSDAIDTNNGKIVKNAKLLKDLINQKKKDQKATVSAAKAQSQLQYTKIVKQLQQAVKAMALDYKAYGYVTQATYQNISALRDQISAIKNAIREYALLELKLSDVTNAYTEFENAKNRDAELTYGDSLVEAIQALNDGFATGQVGTETFKAALDLIVPPEAYERLDDYQERLIAMHNYVDKNPLFADWFTVDKDGNYGIEFKNMAAFVQDMQNMGVFTGDDITGFNFTDGVNSIEDIVAKTKEFNDGIGATEATIVAMLSELSKYDARFGDLLSEITMTELDKTLKNATEDLDRAIAKQEQFFKDGKDPYGDGASEYDTIQQEINNCSDAYNKAQKAIVDNTNAWIDANNNVDIAKNKVADLTRELQELKDSDTATETEIKIKTEELEVAKQKLSEALQIKYKLGEEPTQMDFQLTLDDVQSQIDNWKSENAILDVNVVPKLQQTQDGTWAIPAEIEAELSDSDKQKIQEYVDLINDEQGLATLLGLIETDPAVSELVQIKDILSEIANVLGISKKVDINKEENKSTTPVSGTELHGNKPASSNLNAASDESSNTNATTTTSDGFSDLSSNVQIEAANQAIQEWADGIKEWAIELKDSLAKFFTETLPEKWDEFWSAVGEWLDDVGEWAQEAGTAIGKFFTETFPEKWNQFWDGVGNFFESIPYAIGYCWGKIKIFFTETLPAKWDEFWDGVGVAFANLKEDAIILKDKLAHFFTVTIPEKWNEFWDAVGVFFTETAPEALSAAWNKLAEFFTVTIPEKWNSFWDSVSEYISTNITPALSAFWDKIVEFFTITIPEKWNSFWDSVGVFFTETIPAAFESVKEGVTTFFTVTLPAKWSEFWGGISSWFGEKINEFLGFLSSIKNRFNTGYEDATSGNDYNPSRSSSGSSKRGLAQAKGNAHSQSDVGLKNNEHNAVVGELGRELVVDPNKGVYYTVGDNGTEMVDLPKGAIIYNHKQTEELLKNGYTSRGKLTGGLSFAKGNAHPTPSNADGYNHGLFGGYLSDNPVFKDTSKQWVEANKDWVEDYANASDGIVEAADSISDASDAFEETINWIEVLFTRIDNILAEHEAYYETLTDTVSSIYSGAANAISTTNAEIIAFGQQMQQAFNQTKVDLTNRPNVSGSTMRQAGWDDANDDDYATVHTVTFTGSDFGLTDEYGKDFAINVTPILPDGTVINGGEDGLWEYINGKLDEGKSLEDLDVFLGSYATIEKAVSEAEKLHEMQEEYYAMVNEYDNNSLSSLAEKEEILNAMYTQLYNKASYSIDAANYYSQLAESILAGMDVVIAEKVRNGTILIEEITDEALKENIDKALEYLDQKSQYTQQYYQTITEIADKAKEHLDDVAQAYENEISLTEHLNDMLEAHNDLLETREGFAAEAYYKAQISANETMLSQYKAERKALQDVLDAEIAAKRVKIGDQQWFEMQQAIYDVDDAIIDMEASIEDLQNYINDLHWDRFDELINRFGYIEEEISNVIQLISHDPDGLIREELRDLTTDNWATGSGMATIGLYAQEMERAQYVANEYAQAIKQLERDRDKYNETEYLKKMNELISAQYENIEKYYDAKDAIIELNEARVDAIRDGIEKEIDAYQELIDKKKELLESEQDLHDFQNEISDKEKEVSDIRKQLAAMAGDDTAATTAKRKQLEADLINAQKALEESYYSHSMNAKQEALDKEFSSFEEEKNAEIEKWEEWLTETETVVSEALTYVKENTNLVYTELTELGSQYGLTLSDTLTTPWQNGEIAIDNYSTTFEEAKSVFTDMLDEIALHWSDVTAAAEEAAAAQARALQAEYNKTAGSIPSTGDKGGTNNGTPQPSVPSTPPTTPQQPAQAAKTIKVGGKINAGSALIYEWAGDTTGERQYYRNDPIYTVLKEQNGWLQVRYHKLSSGITGWFKKNQVSAYAKGTLGTKKNEWALIDELGDELVVNADGNGRLSYLTKGTGVVPADLTEKIMKLALDPASALDGAIPKTRIPSITANNFDVNLSFDSLVHADNVTQDTLPELQKVIRNEFNYMMKEVNNGLKRAGKSR